MLLITAVGEVTHISSRAAPMAVGVLAIQYFRHLIQERGPWPATQGIVRGRDEEASGRRWFGVGVGVLLEQRINPMPGRLTCPGSEGP
jgi:hypothetical protein